LESCEEKIKRASAILISSFSEQIQRHLLDVDGCFTKIDFKNGRILYITYNSYEEYSYQFLYSFNHLDREHFDNYDKNWNVNTQPHHFHKRYNSEG
jgi:hypothetical protein